MEIDLFWIHRKNRPEFVAIANAVQRVTTAAAENFRFTTAAIAMRQLLGTRQLRQFATWLNRRQPRKLVAVDFRVALLAQIAISYDDEFFATGAYAPAFLLSMMNPSFTESSISFDSLHHFRLMLLMLESVAMAVAAATDVPILAWSLLLSVWLLHWATWPLLRHANFSHFGARYTTIALLLDITLLSGLLALTGGATNGLVALLLLPVAASAVLLPAPAAWLMALVSIASNVLLLQLGQFFDAQANHHMHHQQIWQQTYSTHLQQMSWGFALSVLVLVWFLSRQTAKVKAAHRQLEQLAQQQARQEQMLTVATYAANAAHDLASPLQNIALLTDELVQDDRDDPLFQDLQHEVARCQHIVQQLRHNAQQLREPQGTLDLTECTRQAIQLWMVSRPDIRVNLTEHGHAQSLPVHDALSFHAALFHVLDNAADAGLSQQHAELAIQLRHSDNQLLLVVQDFGPGLSSDMLAELGQKPMQSQQGLGLGQLIANSTIERLGGRMYRQNQPRGLRTIMVFSGTKS